MLIKVGETASVRCQRGFIQETTTYPIDHPSKKEALVKPKFFHCDYYLWN
jgi:hypothetical protein